MSAIATPSACSMTDRGRNLSSERTNGSIVLTMIKADNPAAHVIGLKAKIGAHRLEIRLKRFPLRRIKARPDGTGPHSIVPLIAE